MKTLRNIYHIRYNRFIPVYQFLFCGKELLVQLQDIKIQFLPYIDSRIAGAEIIYGHPVAVRPQPVNQLLGSGKFIQQNGFRQFKLQKIGRDFISLRDRMDDIGGFRIMDMQA